METCDIVFFKKYYFTDVRNPEGVPHYATLLLPTVASGFENNVYCAVITSHKPKSNLKLDLLRASHHCFSEDVSYLCFNRRDFQSIDDLGNGKKPIDKLTKEECKQGFNILKAALFSDKTISPILRASIVREWKLKKNC